MSILAFMKPGMWELLIILLIILLLFGATRLPKIGKSLGEAIRGFRSSVHNKEEEAKKDEGKDDSSKHEPPAPPSPPSDT